MSGEMIVLVFPSRSALTRALDHLATLEYIDSKRLMVVAKAASGETVILNDGISPDQGSIAGGTLGATMALLGLAQLGALTLPGVGPIIALGTGALVGALVGRATGRFAAHLMEFGIHQEQIDALAARLQQGHPALVMQVKHSAEVLQRLREDLRQHTFELLEAPQLATSGQ
ncbi:MAG: DUF1269 domain-containing protein [Anaerolineae bacterium]|nr:DUF1269 domain-containing protein [Anaerolineae bacterium]